MNNNTVEYRLVAMVDGEEVYDETFYDTDALMESGIRKAENVVASYTEEAYLIEESEEDDE